MPSITSKNLMKIVSVLAVISLSIMFVIASKSPSDFPDKITDIHVPREISLNRVADELVEKKIISSHFFFKIAVAFFSGKGKILAGDYRFTKPQNAFVIAYRMVNGNQGLPRISVTIPEGTNVYDMAFIYLSKLSDFNAPYFVSKAKKYEGYLFPDTYYFLANAKTDEIIRTMRDNFNKKISNINPQIKKFGKTLNDIVIMASIVEEEAKSFEDKRMVAGVLWNRLDNDMLLQVDPPFYFITGKTSGVTYNDLKVDSPYNTYKYKGLPIGPISNPGIKSIEATIDPIPTKYFFYLTGNDGIMRYAVNYDGHINNKKTYLK